MFSMRKVEASHNSAQDQHLYTIRVIFHVAESTEVRFLLSVETPVDQRQPFALIRLCCNMVNKVENSKEHERYAVATFR